MSNTEYPIRKIFIFSFSPWDTSGEPEEDKRGFTINFENQEQFDKFVEWTLDDNIMQDDPEEKCWYEFLGNIESDYGVHDFCTTGWREIVGYHTYEIRLDKRDELMNKWRNYIIRNGYNCGPIITGLSDDDNDYPHLNLTDHQSNL